MRRIQILTDAAADICAMLSAGPERVDDVVARLDTQLPAFMEDRRAARRPTPNPDNPTLHCATCDATQPVTSIAVMAGWAHEDGRWHCPKCFG